jgi:predicted nucleic acid-binding protein
VRSRILELEAEQAKAENSDLPAAMIDDAVAEALERVRPGRFELVTCSIQLGEIRRASRYPKFRGVLKPHRVGRMVNMLQQTLLVDGLSRDHQTADPHDAWRLDLTAAAKADYLVTGDNRAGLLSLETVGKAHVVTAAVFCQNVLRSPD